MCINLFGRNHNYSDIFLCSITLLSFRVVDDVFCQIPADFFCRLPRFVTDVNAPIWSGGPVIVFSITSSNDSL